jgi:hypothetical protein
MPHASMRRARIMHVGVPAHLQVDDLDAIASRRIDDRPAILNRRLCSGDIETGAVEKTAFRCESVLHIDHNHRASLRIKLNGARSSVDGNVLKRCHPFSDIAFDGPTLPGPESKLVMIAIGNRRLVATQICEFADVRLLFSPRSKGFARASDLWIAVA